MLWAYPLPGEGSTTPIVSGGRVFVNSTNACAKDLLGLFIDVETDRKN